MEISYENADALVRTIGGALPAPQALGGGRRQMLIIEEQAREPACAATHNGDGFAARRRRPCKGALILNHSDHLLETGR